MTDPLRARLEAIERLDELVDAVCSRLRAELPANEADQRYRQGMLDIRQFQARATQLREAALRAVPEDQPVLRPWRVGRKVGRTIYQQQSADPADGDVLIGLMDSRELAQAAVDAYNRLLAARAAAPEAK